MDVAALTFHHIEGAERAFADARDRDPEAPWLNEAAFVEVHRKRRIRIRGTIAGHYVDIDTERGLDGGRTRTGTVTGAAIGVAFGLAGVLAGSVLGGAFGSDREPDDTSKLNPALSDEILADVPEKSSAIIVFGAAEHVDAMVAAFEGSPGLVRHRLTPAAARQIEEAVAAAPVAAPGTT